VLLGENDLLEVLVEDDEGDRALRRSRGGTKAHHRPCGTRALSQRPSDARVFADELIVGDTLITTDSGIHEIEESACRKLECGEASHIVGRKGEVTSNDLAKELRHRGLRRAGCVQRRRVATIVIAPWSTGV
jgi:hypothetical protein